MNTMCGDVFFFQAEDGIRDRDVTGVQTCALPIFASHAVVPFKPPIGASATVLTRMRSEERRVGKECRAGRWWERRKKAAENNGYTAAEGTAANDRILRM